MSRLEIPFLAGLFGLLFASLSTAKPMEVNIDADYSLTVEAAFSIDLGLRTALEQAGGLLGGEEVAIVPTDLRANVRRSRDAMERYLASDTALALFGSLRSPP